MQTLVIYDSTGKIYYQASGAVTEPTGIPFLWVDVPNGKYAKSVDVSGETAVAVLESIPLSELEQKVADLEAEQLNTQLTITLMQTVNDFTEGV